VFRLDLAGGSFGAITSFNGANGAYPQGGLILNGPFLYGTAPSGGAYGYGVVYKLSVNLPPSISAPSVLARTAGSASSVSTIATVSDAQDAAGSLSVTATTVPNGITIGNITNTNGVITAAIGATCTAAPGANSITLQVLDSAGDMATTTLTVNVSPNTAPSLGTYSDVSLASGSATDVVPASAPADNGTVTNVSVSASPGFSGTVSVLPSSGVVSISNANTGTHTVTVTATDNCGATATRSFVVTVAAPTCTTPPSNLVSWWPGDGNANDIAGGHNGTPHGGVSFAPGVVGDAFRFNGVDGIVEVPYNNAFNIQSQLTIDAWVKKTGSCTNNCIVVIKQDTSACCNSFRYGLILYGANGNVPGHVTLAFHRGFWQDVVVSNAALQDNVWYHIAGTYDGTTAKVYINGALDKSVPASGAITASTQGPLYIGGDVVNSSVERFRGLIDEPSLYNRALTGAEIASIAAAQSAGKCKPPACTPPPSGLAGWWPADGNANDLTGAHPGQLLGGTFVEGKVRQALQLNALGDGIRAANVAVPRDFTIEGWIYPAGLAFGSPHPGPGPIAEFFSTVSFFQHPSSSDLHLALRDVNTGGIGTVTAYGGITPNAWNHAAVSYSQSTGIIRLYANGVETGSFNFGAVALPASADFYVGQRGPGSFDQTGNTYNGRVDEVRLFDRILSAAEIQSIYAAGSGGACTDFNRRPVINAASALTRSAGTSAAATIATVSDLEDGPATLTVTAISVPSGLSVSGISNAGGSITAQVAASCGAAAGANAVVLQVQDSGGATSTATLIVNVVAPAAPTIAANGPTTFCSGGSVTLTASSGSSYLWSTGATTQSITVATSGSFSVSVTNANGCSSASSPTTVTAKAKPAVPVITTTAGNGQATLTATGTPDLTYAWTLNDVAYATGNPIVTTTSGTYAVVATNLDGCSSRSAPSAVVITNSNQPTTTINGVTISSDSFPAGTMLSVDLNPQSLPPAPTGYYTLTDANGQVIGTYQISSSTSPTSKIELAFDVPVSLAPDKKALQAFRILHGERDKNGNYVLVDRTVRHDFSNNPVVRRVIGAVTSLSPFVLTYVLGPTIESIQGPTQPLSAGSSTAFNATFTDPTFTNPAAGDNFTATWSWGDGTSQTATLTPPIHYTDGTETAGVVTGSHTYTTPGVYTVTLGVSDGTAAGGAAEAQFQYVVVYDPSGGFVTGGGWIDSAPGGYRANAALSGKATFGFVSRYQKGATVPEGQTQFDFRVADFRFKSTAYDWLVVSGPKAHYNGVGEVNGISGYAFLLTATDGDVAGGGGTDKFRIKIWNRSSGAIVYDNVLDAGATDDIENAKPQAIGGGTIVIHK
jgi:hypothetical protein